MDAAGAEETVAVVLTVTVMVVVEGVEETLKELRQVSIVR